jgi:hypothetical protein
MMNSTPTTENPREAGGRHLNQEIYEAIPS